MVVPTVTSNELSKRIQDSSTPETTKKVLIGILNDFMDLMYARESPYTTGKQVIPSECTIEDVNKAIDETNEKKFKEIFVKISETYKSGDLTPQSVNNCYWEPKFKPVLVFVTPNP